MLYKFWFLSVIAEGGKRSLEEPMTRRQQARTMSFDTTSNPQVRLLSIMASNLGANVAKLAVLEGTLTQEEVRLVADSVLHDSTLPLCMYLELKKTRRIGDIYAKCEIGTYYPVVINRWFQAVVLHDEEPDALGEDLVRMTPEQKTRMINHWTWSATTDWPVFQATTWMLMAMNVERSKLHSELGRMGFHGSWIKVIDFYDNTRSRGRIPLRLHHGLLEHPEITTGLVARETFPEINLRNFGTGRIMEWRKVTGGEEVVMQNNVARMTAVQFERLLKLLISETVLVKYPYWKAPPVTKMSVPDELGSKGSSQVAAITAVPTFDENPLELTWSEEFDKDELKLLWDELFSDESQNLTSL